MSFQPCPAPFPCDAPVEGIGEWFFTNLFLGALLLVIFIVSLLVIADYSKRKREYGRFWI